jgi:hypothetical protein
MNSCKQRGIRSGRYGTWCAAGRLGVLALAAAAVMIVLAGCGGGEGQPLPVNGTDSTPGGTATPTIEVAGGVESGSGNQEIYVPPRDFRDVGLSLGAGDVVELHFVARSQVVGRSALGTGGSQQGDVETAVTLAVTDPLGDVVYTGEEIQEETVEITAEFAGEYKFSFINNFSLQGQTVVMDYVVNP